MNIILHITQRAQWEAAQKFQIYRGDTLESEGFIHCSTPQQVINVANTFFENQQGLVLLCIDSDKVHAEIRYEGIQEDELFPHIYGALNLDAVFQVIDFKPHEDGSFAFPLEIINFMS
ncbi:DUF952 domain-containing protein [Chroogloeocystis siderophila]|jgi:uncharacterized protein (DUF952 family)|uniref:DUF952 domain-containing protein n=1 Tax=Chroogloeocystis siderophila 5.2 s.c.1 TaxID=247279 RepID=A0A1U7I079_9CHRO|nr:DUF952 domain-containing protein [Chroogloeocystis siderophila]OKH29281.1 hypothetical protein NIES1031_01470 [Chroogloeocystis siderophila 5.2 s.c.1]